MAERCAVVFPGQGAYLPAVLTRLAVDEPLVEETLRLLDSTAVRLGRSAPSRFLLDEAAPTLSELVDEAPADLHTALFAAEMVLFRLLTERHGLRPDVLLGHSFGELVALTAAGVYGLEEGMALVAARDEAFAARPPEPGGMLALDVSASRAAGLLVGLGEWEVTLAADNSPRQCVLSGPVGPLGRVRQAAEAIGITTTALRVPYAFHHHILAAVAGDFTRRATSLRAGPARYLLHSAILGRRVDDTDAVADLVAAHLVRPTRFTGAVRLLHAQGVEVFVECGPRGVLSDLVTATVPGVRVVAPLRRRASGSELADALHDLTSAPPAAPVHRPGPAWAPVGAAHDRTAAGTRDASAATETAVTTAAPAATTVAVGTATEEPSSSAAPLPDRRSVVATLRTLYANALGYPPEVLTDHADLEADLGVDSIKQTELFARAAAHFGRTLPADGSRLTSYTTLDALAGLLSALPAHATRAGVSA
ncbi:acyltransferase domain-containing protein [Streptomyces sp. MMS24-I2-30]|uniref:acyltransferase domain-containing protein n=1 Tax=Streptomyces sp. MMS24-I2-30 TaxID=3351564 RepID=UPI003896A594